MTIPESKIPKDTTSQLRTAYDVTTEVTKTPAYKRFVQPMNDLADQVMNELYNAWRR